jgi:hypothetical protein
VLDVLLLRRSSLNSHTESANFEVLIFTFPALQQEVFVKVAQSSLADFGVFQAVNATAKGGISLRIPTLAYLLSSQVDPA